jgi:arginase
MLDLLCVPYHLGRRDVGMGKGPAALLDAGAARIVQQADPEAAIEWVELPEPFEHEVQASFALQRALASHVATIRKHSGFPVVLGGNCSCCVATAAGVGDTEDGGVVWFDAHADAHTPDTTTSGFLDGMPVSVLTGRSWPNMAQSIPGFKPLTDERVVLVGCRSMEDAERDLVGRSGISLIAPEDLSGDAEGLAKALDALAAEVESVHLHVDLDVIDLSDGRANEYAAEGGPTIPQLHHAITTVGSRCRVNSVSLTSYNPDVDADGRALRAGLDLLGTLVDVAVDHAARKLSV